MVTCPYFDNLKFGVFGAVFFSVIYHVWIASTEVQNSFLVF